MTVQSGLSFWTGLTLIFITLKLIGMITWSWVWVLAPLWIPWVTLIGILLLGALGYVCFFVLALMFNR